jgi:hypothetical protein
VLFPSFTLKIAAARSSKKLITITRLQGVTSQNTVIFSVSMGVSNLAIKSKFPSWIIVLILRGAYNRGAVWPFFTIL